MSISVDRTVVSLVLSGAVCVGVGLVMSHYLLPPPSSRCTCCSPLPPREQEKKSQREGNETGSSMRRSDSFVWASGRPIVRVVITGVSAALPGPDKPAFTPGVNNIHRIIDGESFIHQVPTSVKDSMLEKNVVLVKKNKSTGAVDQKVRISAHEHNINLCASIGQQLDLQSYGVPAGICNTMDRAVQVAVAAGLEALKDAGIVTGEGQGTEGWVLPGHLQQSTGIVYATSFPALDTAISEVTKFFRSQAARKGCATGLLSSLRDRMKEQLQVDTLPQEAVEALESLRILAESAPSSSDEQEVYEFDRKFLFRVLVLGNAQLAQIVKARGPNMQTNAACAGSTQAVALAHDMIQLGRAERMIVVAGDNASSDDLMPWLGNGFRALGAATIASRVEDGALPFDARRTGMILGSGGVGMVLESEEGARRRHLMAMKYGHGHGPAQRPAFKCRLLGTLYSNSAYHGAALDRKHIAEEMERFISTVEREHNISRSEIARHGVYFSHETSTNASPNASCASNELYGLRKVFGDDFKHLLILNTKGFTGHPMGVSFEDVVAVEVLATGRVPAIANLTQVDPHLGSDLKLSRGGSYPCKYAIRFAAGFGSQIALALYGGAST